MQKALVTAALSLALVSPALAADVPIYGRLFRVEDPLPGKNAHQRTVVVDAIDRPGLPIDGNPKVHGVTLVLFASGDASSADQAFVIPGGAFEEPNGPGWTGSTRCRRGRCRTNFNYHDERGENGPIVKIKIQAKTRGLTRLLVRASAQGNNGTIDVVPPNPGRRGGVIVTIPEGARLCSLFSEELGGEIETNTAEEFSVTGSSPTGCPPSD